MTRSEHTQRCFHPGAYLQQECQDRQLSLQKLACLLGEDEQHLQNVLSGEVGLSVDLAQKIQQKMGIPLDLLMHLQKDFDV